MGVSPSQFRGRPTVTTTVVVDGVTRTTTASPWTAEDRALMLAWREYQNGICSGCGHPKATAWHPDNALGAFEMVDQITCWACTAAKERGEDGQREPVTFPIVIDHRDYTKDPLPAASDDVKGLTV